MRKSTKVPRILKIHQIDGFKITCVFNTGEYKTIDFGKRLHNVSETDPKYALKDIHAFQQVVVNESHTLAWPNIKVKFRSFEKLGEMKEAPLDLDPVVLYDSGEDYEAPYKNKYGRLLREARKSAGLTQDQLAERSGTTKTYISKIENGRSGIELDTLEKIVSVGLGKELSISIGRTETERQEKTKRLGRSYSRTSSESKRWRGPKDIKDQKTGLTSSEEQKG
ncbi:hypothetical protein AHMF7605_29035 [Adhaeribacter arboris]|uniref:HTH cro/C1-type domain-containing protein n=1 Tax=Adhaeribacter arboris TaxID=2072846 RepID=A0A2T2Y8Y3_9BACT|nr:helix-turn-helix transcriptional regulator [Adhaeribacter arboris]PSR51956.1 hypothetical protein AHMF7605_29035 [Adhaeribacter arboris]